jgi:hypothetical protein
VEQFSISDPGDVSTFPKHNTQDNNNWYREFIVMSEHHNHQQCCIWDTYKFAFYSKFREPTLYRYAAQGDWDLIPDRCKAHPKEAGFVHKYAPMDTPLCRLLRTDSCKSCAPDVKDSIFRMKFNAVSALLDVNVESAISRDTFQRTSLHWACMDVEGNHGEADDSIICMLLEKAPSASHMLDIEHRTPLHYLVARNDIVPMKLVAKMVALFPEALKMKDEVGETPAEIVQSRIDEIKGANELMKYLRKLETMFSPASTSRGSARDDDSSP